MGGFRSRLDGGMRRLGWAATILGAAMLLAPSWAIPEASAKAKSAKSDLGLGPAGDGTGARGSIQFKPSRGGDRVRLRLRNLLPKTRYEVRDGLTGSVLAGVRTNRLGKVKASFRADRLPNGDTLGLAGLPVEVCVAGTDGAVLEGTVPGDSQGNDDGCAPWTDFTYSTGTVSTDPDAAVQVSLTLTSQSSQDLETPLDSMSLFVGPGGFDFYGNADHTMDIPGPVTLWIADGEEGLQQVASIDANSCDGEFGTDDGDNSNLVGPDGTATKDTSGPRHGRKHHRHSTQGDRGGDGTGTGDGTGDGNGDGNDGGDGGDQGGGDFCYSYYFWYADNYEKDTLPFGVTTVAALVGRAFEVRDADGTVLLSGTLPELEEVVFEDPFKDFVFESGTVQTEYDASIQASVTMSHWSDGTDGGTDDSISVFVGTPIVWFAGGDGAGPAVIPGPVTFSIADGDGNLQVVATIEAFDWFQNTPPFDGNGTTTVKFAFPGGGDGNGGDWPVPPPFYMWSADSMNGDGLPLGVTAVKDLVGRTFELRDGEGNLLFSGVLPELQSYGGPTGDPSNGGFFPAARK